MCWAKNLLDNIPVPSLGSAVNETLDRVTPTELLEVVGSQILIGSQIKKLINVICELITIIHINKCIKSNRWNWSLKLVDS
jgi:hypothetical protein